MTVLVTEMKNIMSKRTGYMSLSDLLNNIDVYKFNQCIKIRNEKDKMNFNQWICYWEDAPIAVLCDVRIEKIVTGFLQLAIISKKMVDVNTIGPYPYKQPYGTCYMVNDKISTKQTHANSLIQYINEHPDEFGIANTNVNVIKPNKIQRNKVDLKEDLSNSQIEMYRKQIAEAWGITLRKK